MVKILKTIDWQECKDSILVFASERISSSAESLPCNFADFLASYPMLLHPKIFSLLQNMLMSERYSDITDKTVEAENRTLFAKNGDNQAEALELALSGEKLFNHYSSWLYLDNEKKCMVNFVCFADLVQVRLFCSCSQVFSALHLVDIDGKIIAVPVLFTGDLANYQSITDRQNHPFLRTYLPRDEGDLLSKKKHRTHYSNLPSSTSKSRCVDKGDSL